MIKGQDLILKQSITYSEVLEGVPFKKVFPPGTEFELVGQTDGYLQHWTIKDKFLDFGRLKNERRYIPAGFTVAVKGSKYGLIMWTLKPAQFDFYFGKEVRV